MGPVLRKTIDEKVERKVAKFCLNKITDLEVAFKINQGSSKSALNHRAPSEIKVTGSSKEENSDTTSNVSSVENLPAFRIPKIKSCLN